MIRGAIFDLDGTILDSMFIWDTIGESYLRSLGIEPKEDLKKTFQTFSLEQAAHYYREYYQVTLSIEEIINGVNDMVARYYTDMVPLKPCVNDFLLELKKQGIRMCIATATERKLAEAALKRCKVRKLFSEIFTCTQAGKSKESPDIYRAAQRHLGTEKKETIVFEDAVHALYTAKADGFVTAAVYDIHEENQEKMKAISDFYIKDFSEVDVILKLLFTVDF